VVLAVRVVAGAVEVVSGAIPERAGLAVRVVTAGPLSLAGEK
jgi:hypothetical protein